jgi:hypothetical protein
LPSQVSGQPAPASAAATVASVTAALILFSPAILPATMNTIQIIRGIFFHSNQMNQNVVLERLDLHLARTSH